MESPDLTNDFYHRCTSSAKRSRRQAIQLSADTSISGYFALLPLSESENRCPQTNNRGHAWAGEAGEAGEAWGAGKVPGADPGFAEAGKRKPEARTPKCYPDFIRTDSNES
jgi:hypothetical protein